MEATKTGCAPINGLQMYYETYGLGGKPLVLVHSGGSNIESCFNLMIPLLAKHVPVFFLLPGRY